MNTEQNAENALKLWRIPVSWEMCGTVWISAATLSEAMEIARDPDGQLPLPDDKDYVDGSWQLSYEDIDFIRDSWNDKQQDCLPPETEGAKGCMER